MKKSKNIELIKYGNRKIYIKAGTLFEEGRYLNLKEIRDLIKLGHSIKVQDKNKKLDVTDDVLNEVLKTCNHLSITDKINLIKGQNNV